MTMQPPPDQYPHVLQRGAAAQLSALRNQGGGSEELQAIFFRQRYGEISSNEERYGYVDGGEEENYRTSTSTTTTSSPYLLLQGGSIPVTVRLEEDNDSNNNDTTSIAGCVFVTQSQLLFVANDANDMDHDLAIGASCMLLHAMMDDPQMAVYLQLQPAGDDDNDGGPTEITLTPSSADDCKSLFDGLCKLVAAHPNLGGEDDDDDDGFGGGAGVPGGMFGMGSNWMMMGNDDDADNLVWAAPAPSSNGVVGIVEANEDEVGGGASAEARLAMLDRLDNMLVVQPNVQVQEDQFEDAEDVEDGYGQQ